MLDRKLAQLSIPYNLTDSGDFNQIDNYFNSVMGCIQSSLHDTFDVIKKKSVLSDVFIPGWNDYVQDLHTVAKKQFFEWVAIGKPRSGELFSHMRRSRAEFKRALRFCRQHEEQLKLNTCELSYDSKDPKAFWNAVYRAGNSAVKNNVVNKGNAYGDNDIASM